MNTRLEQHNAGMTKSTKPYRPWRLVHHEEFGTLSEAGKREFRIKSWKSRPYLKAQLDIGA